MAKKQICLTLEIDLINELEKVKEETGIAISTQIELRLKGYEIKKSKPK